MQVLPCVGLAKSPSAATGSSHCRPSSHPVRRTAPLQRSTPTSPLNWQAPTANPCRVQMCSQSTGRGTTANPHRGRETLHTKHIPPPLIPFLRLLHIFTTQTYSLAQTVHEGDERTSPSLAVYALYSLPITQSVDHSHYPSVDHLVAA